MKLAIVGLLVALSSLPSPSAQAQDPARDRESVGGSAADRVLNAWIARADRLVERDRKRAARRLLTRAAERAPRSPRVALRLFRLDVPQTAAEAAEPDEATREAARRVAERLHEARPDAEAEDGGARTARRLRLARQWAVAVAGDHREAIEALSLAAPRHGADHAAALRRLAALAVRRHDLHGADEALAAARRVDPVDPALLVDHALVRLARGRSDDAVAMLEEVLQRRPELVAVRRDLAGALLAAGRAPDAVNVLAALAGEEPDDVTLQLELSRASLAAGDAARAVRAARRARSLAEASDPEPSLALARALTAQGLTEEAEGALEEALRRDPGNARARAALRALRGE